MLYFGSPWPTVRDCTVLYRVDVGENEYLTERFWKAPADRWTVDGWVPAPTAQLNITEGENELWGISPESLVQAMVAVLESRNATPAQIEAALRREGVPFPDPSTSEVVSPQVLQDQAAEPDEVTPMGLDIVYVDDDGRGGAMFAKRHIAKIAADKCRAVTDSKTWGQFRTVWPDDHFDESNGYPGDDTPFKRSDLPPLGEGFPEEPWPPDDVVSWFPDDLITKYGCRVRFTPEGSDLYIPQTAAREIAEELRARGNLVEESVDDLPTWVSYWY